MAIELRVIVPILLACRQAPVRLLALAMVLALALVLPLSMPLAARAADQRLAQIHARGHVTCGIWPQVPGFAADQHGKYAGFDIDTCRAVAAAILGDATKVEFVSVQAIEQFRQQLQIDLVVRRLTWTPARENGTGMKFGPVTFHDGQGFLVPRHSGIHSPAQLAGERVCVISEERHPQILASYFSTRGQQVQLVLVQNDTEAEAALRARRCAAYSADVSWLAAARAVFSNGVERYELLPQLISAEPLAPLLRAEDLELQQWVRWTVGALIKAEELGLDSRNIDDPAVAAPLVRQLLAGLPDETGGPESASRVRALIGGVGNYGEVFERNLGAASAIKLDRGLYRQWTKR